MARQPQPTNRNETLEEDVLSQMGFEEDEDNDLLEDDDDDATDPVAENDEDDAGDDLPDPDEDDLTQDYPADKRGNLVDKNKQIVARSGQERTVFEKTKSALKKATAENAAVKAELQKITGAARDLFTKYKDLQDKAKYSSTIGLNETESKEALEIYARMKTDPRGALKYILTKMHLAGNDLQDIGVSGPLDPKAIADEAIKKHLAATKSVEKTPEEMARETAERFLTDIPDAKPYVELIARAKQRRPDLSLYQIWYRMVEHAAKQQKPTQHNRHPPGKKPGAPVAHNSTRREDKRRTLDNSPRDPRKSFSEIGRELLRDLQSTES